MEVPVYGPKMDSMKAEIRDLAVVEEKGEPAERMVPCSFPKEEMVASKLR